MDAPPRHVATPGLHRGFLLNECGASAFGTVGGFLPLGGVSPACVSTTIGKSELGIGGGRISESLGSWPFGKPPAPSELPEFAVVSYRSSVYAELSIQTDSFAPS